MRLREFAPSPERDDGDEMPNQLLVLANRWWNATDKQPQIEHVLNSLGWSIHQVESEDDAVQLQHRDGTTYFISADDFDPDLFELVERLPALINKTANVDGIQVSINTNEKNASVYASSNSRRLGYAEFDRDDKVLVPYDLAVDDKYRGQGIAAVMYDYAKSLGFTIRASADQTDDGKYFWRKNRGNKRVWESNTQMSTEQMLNYLRQHHDPNLHSDYTNYIENTFDHFELRTVPVANIPTDLSGLDKSKVERYRQMDFSKAPPVVIGDKHLLDGYHRVNAAKALGIPTVKAYVGVKKVNEIARIPQSELGDWGEAGTLAPPDASIKKKELPGGSGYTYAVEKNGQGNLEIMIFDGEKLAAELDLFETQDVLGTWGVETVVVERPYRGQGLGKALYGIALSILKLTIEAGQTQTKHGQAMWLMLNSIPGVEVKGYNMVPTDKYQPNKNDTVVKQDADWTRYTFPVQPGKQSMRSGRRGTGLYNSQATMIAKWTGQ
jgi:GNAT superfamily N-acetyltransferase